MLLAKVLGHTATDLGEGATHDSAKVALLRRICQLIRALSWGYMSVGRKREQTWYSVLSVTTHAS